MQKFREFFHSQKFLLLKYLQSKPKKRGYRKRMHEEAGGNERSEEGMKEVREQQICDQRKQIEEKHWLEELEIETIKQKIEGQRTKYTESKTKAEKKE